MGRSWRQGCIWTGLALAASLTACAGRAPEPAPLPPVPLDRIPARALQRVRVLLASDFRSATIQNSTHGETVVVFSLPDRMVLTDPERGQELLEGSGFRFEPAQGRLLQLQDATYRGTLEAFLNPLGHPVLVNELPLEEYLRGVVPNELGPKVFPEPAALEAQSVAARTYTVARAGSFAADGFDLHSDERSQVYRGLQSEQDLSDQAVMATAGRIALYQGRPIEAFYSSTCGGITAAYHEVFKGNPIPYLPGGVACPDQQSRYHRWSETLPLPLIQDRLDQVAGVGRLQDLRIEQRDATGRVTLARFIGKQGEILLRGLDFRRALGLRSHFVDSLEVERDRGGSIVRLRLSGRGFGHGVGLCQIGSVALARRGESYDKILQTYYPGASIVRIY